jgi:DNA-binding beta-propeller fold protein YncE
MALTVDAGGNVYVVDGQGGTRIRKISPGGAVTTFAGSYQRGTNDGTGAAASFTSMRGITADASGTLYVVDQRSVRKVSPTAQVTTLSAVPLDDKSFIPNGVAVDRNGNLFVTDEAPWGTIDKITPARAKTVFTGAGGASMPFFRPFGIAFNPAGETMYVVDNASNSVYKVAPNGSISLFAGDQTRGFANGFGTAAKFKGPKGIAIDKNGYVYVADGGNTSVRKISPAGEVSTLYYDSGGIIDVAVDASGNVYVALFNGHKIVKLTPGA